ncbi:cathepsin B-like [Amyelois transitella]|uniref:cathepsin B-like n=1 Tax=Amyelois transitella TaxID=680683 RepID=UPI00298F53F3|nr:cathepsin B-like [Amyelois transitella]
MFVFLLFLLFDTSAVANNHLHPLSDEFIDLINSKQNLWKAGRNYPEDIPIEHLTGLFGSILNELREGDAVKVHDANLIASLPETFDAREKWHNCPSLNEIRDQGGCGSCWAFGAVEAMTDRWCIHSNGSQFHFSAQDMVGCVTKAKGCHGGAPIEAWNFWNTDGVVSGGNYNSKEGCRPYEIQECIHDNSPRGNCSNHGKVHCFDKCRSGYNVPFEKDKRFGLTPYRVMGEDHIKAELYLNGPLEAGFLACPDILHYKTGVYKCVIDPPDNRCKGHAVKILGWGVENGTNYWLLANSWNTNWGELGGFFKFIRGENHMRIENEVVGGMPNYEK